MDKLIRSLLFVPGNKPDRFDKAFNSGADLICIDLEDAVAVTEKEQSLAHVCQYLQSNAQVCIRINALSSQWGESDIRALATYKPAYVMLAKCANVDEVNKAAALLSASPDTQLIALIESLEGLDNAKAIAAHPSVNTLMFGGADMSAELRCQFAYQPLLLTRSQLVQAAARAGKALIDVPYIHIQDEQGLIEETQRVIDLGFSAKAAIHPRQLASIHNVFSPTEQAVSDAQQIIDSVSESDGVAVVNGRMIDRPIILAAKRTLALAAACNKDR